MKTQKVNRRQFLNTGGKLLAFIPMAGMISCFPDNDSKLSPEYSLKKLIFIIGPWALKDRLIAEDFAGRFLKVNQYLPKSAKIIQSLSARFPDNTWAEDNIDLNEIPEIEAKLIVALSKQLYSLVEVRFYVSNEPPWGQCQGNNNWHTRTPE